MKYTDETFDSSAENLAWDEALLDLCEAGAGDETLRFWEAREPFVVVGYANHAAREVDLIIGTQIVAKGVAAAEAPCCKAPVA